MRGQILHALAPSSSQRRPNGLLHPAEPAPLPAERGPSWASFFILSPLCFRPPAAPDSSQSIDQSINQSNDPANRPSPRSFGACARREKKQTDLEHKAEIRSGRLVILATWRWLQLDFCIVVATSASHHHIGTSGYQPVLGTIAISYHHPRRRCPRRQSS